MMECQSTREAHIPGVLALQVLEKEEEANELRRKLGELIRLVEQFQDTVPEDLSKEVCFEQKSNQEVPHLLAMTFQQNANFGNK